jgi:hypothetical protein
MEHDWSQAEQLIEKMKSRHIDTGLIRTGNCTGEQEWER